MKTLIFFIAVFVFLGSGTAFSQQNVSEKGKDIHYLHSLETSPVSPLLQMIDKGIWGIKYGYAPTRKDEIHFGLAYMNLYFDEGNTNSPGLIFGYRRYIWKDLFVEYEIWPCYDKFYEKNEDKYYESFDLWNEFRVGYKFDFTISDLPFHVNVTWPFGFGLYSSNKPDSFYDRMDQGFGDKYFFHFPLVFIGYKF
ncbi:MAG: hypothetical protein ACOC2K_00735 [Bacteroidota bacterium]